MNASPLRRPALWTAALPVACAVHCVAMPLAALFVPVVGHATGVEAGIMLASAALAVATTVYGVRAHGRRAVWLPVLVGFAVWAASLAGWTEPLPEPATTVLGSLLVAGGLMRNARLRHAASCRSCGCPAHPAGE
ncbi:MAG TPA: MerC domain-containing protein [Longimicrobiaceae bacterium]|nr:MerC domain-containing protein [Longimicrobiaceae bacterium]